MLSPKNLLSPKNITISPNDFNTERNKNLSQKPNVNVKINLIGTENRMSPTRLITKKYGSGIDLKNMPRDPMKKTSSF